jgi:hypothetical protein
MGVRSAVAYTELTPRFNKFNSVFEEFNIKIGESKTYQDSTGGLE